MKSHQGHNEDQKNHSSRQADIGKMASGLLMTQVYFFLKKGVICIYPFKKDNLTKESKSMEFLYHHTITILHHIHKAMKANTPGCSVKRAPVYCGWLSYIALDGGSLLHRRRKATQFFQLLVEREFFLSRGCRYKDMAIPHLPLMQFFLDSLEIIGKGEKTQVSRK